MTSSVNFRNADSVIEKFGGIRPLANKLGVPVTTVQGWKKRNSIPEGRWQEIQKLADELNLSLADTNDNNIRPITASSATVLHEPLREKIVVKRGYSLAQGILVTGVSVGLSVAVLAVLFGPDFIVSNPNQRIAALENKVATAPQGAPGSSSSLEDTINNTIMPRLNEMQAQIGALGDPETLAQISANMKTMQQSAEGQATLNAAVTELQTLVAGLQGNVKDLDVALAEAQKENGALAETIGKVSSTDLTAAAMLLALNQFRASIDRQEPLADDIALLKSVINPDENPDLAASIDRLTPFATSGVMSAAGLQGELQGLAGEIVQARLEGKQAPWQDIAKARLQELFDIRRNGQPVFGTQEQKAVARAQQQLAAGDIAGAKSTLESLPDASRQVAQPVIDKANQTLAAKQVESEITRHFAQSLEGLRSGIAPIAQPAQPQISEPASTTGIAPVTPQEAPEILETTPITPPGTTPSAPATEATPEGAQPAPNASSL